MNAAKCLIALFVVLASVGCRADSRAADSGQYARICTMPMPGVGMVPMTRERIEKSCLNLGQLASDDAQFQRIMALLAGAGPGAFDGQEVRATITLPDRSKVYISKFGEIDRNGVTTQLKAQDLATLIAIFKQLEAQWEKRCGDKLGTAGCEAGGQAPVTAPATTPPGR